MADSTIDGSAESPRDAQGADGRMAMTETDSLTQILEFLLAVIETLVPILAGIFGPMISAAFLSLFI